MSASYDRFREEDGDAHLRLMRLAFGQAPAGSVPFWRRAGADALRVMRDGADVVATAALLRWEHVLGGRPVPSVGVSAVAVDPGRRGGGLGTSMMREALAEMRAAGAALASLYAATAPVYVRLGFGRAAAHVQWTAPAADFAGVRTDARAEPADPGDPATMAAIEASHRARALGAWSGPALRDGFLWRRTLAGPDGAPADLFLLRRADGTVAGHAALARRAIGVRPAVQAFADACALDAEGAAALFALAASLRSTVEAVTWTGGADEPASMLAPEARVRVDRHEDLFVRVLDLPAALAARGWPPGPAARLVLAAEDDLFPENRGPWLLRVADGAAAVEPAPGAAPDLTVAAVGAGPLLTGRAPPRRLASLGLLRGTGAGLDAAMRLFAGPSPWMPDFF